MMRRNDGIRATGEIPMRASLLTGAAVFAAAAGFSFAASAADPAGTAIAVKQSTTAQGAEGQRTLAAAGPVYSGDRVNTNGGGQAQLLFRDQTKLVVGPNSSVVIDDFVFASSATASSVSISAAKGTLRFITGASPKPAYRIKTPTATIGVRGTQIDLSVVAGVTNFVLWEGAARICDLRNRCLDVRGTCEVVVVPRENDAQRLARSAATSQFLANNFPYAYSQDSLQPAFRVDTSGCGGVGGQPNFGGSPGGAVPAPSGGEGEGEGEGGF
jgi:hypothetical protein